MIEFNPLSYSRRNKLNLRSASQAGLRLASDLMAIHAGRRNRQYSAAERERCLLHFQFVLMDLLSAVGTDETLYIGYSRGQPNFILGGCYWNEEKNESIVSRTFFLAAIDFLADEGLIENLVAEAGYGGFSSRMRATPDLVQMFTERGLNWACITVDEDAPVIVVRDEDKKQIPFPETKGFPLEDSIRNLKRINQNLQTSLLNLNISNDDFQSLKLRLVGLMDDPDEHIDVANNAMIAVSEREPIDFSNRSLKRVFGLGSFSVGGRFYGGWWQGIPNEYRKYIEIEGCVTVEMDYSTMQPRILYAKVGEVPPEDAYDLDGWNTELRDIIKKAFSQLINSDITSKPENQWHRFAPDFTQFILPDNWPEMSKAAKNVYLLRKFKERTGRDYPELIGDLLSKHEPIEEFFFSKAWGWVQFLDSQIAEQVMIKLLNHSPAITALPIHDSFIVRRGGEELLDAIMKETFEEIIGTEVKVDHDNTVYDAPEGHEGSRLINSSALFDDARSHMETHSKYHIREAQWVRQWGLEGYE